MNAQAYIEGSTVRMKSGVLPPRQSECAVWVAEGKDDSEISVILGISPATVAEHISKAMKQLDAHKRAQLVAKCFTKGLMSSLCLVLVLFSSISTDSNVMRIRCTSRANARPACTRQVHQGA